MLARCGGLVALAAIASALAWWRLDSITRDTLWAEDSRIFLSGALHPTSPFEVFEPYAGYLQVVPRIAASIVVGFAPISAYAVTMTALMCAVAGVAAALVYVLSRDLRISRVTRIALAIVTVAAPGILNEILGNGANIHSVLLWLSPFLLLYRPRSWFGAIALAVVTLLVFTSEIQAIIFLPLLLWHGRHRRKLPTAAAAAIGTAFEIWASFSSVRTSTAELHPLALVYGFALQAGGSEWVSRTVDVGRIVAEHGWGVALALLVPATAAAVFLVIRRPRDRYVTIAFVAAAVIIFAAGTIVNWSSTFDYPGYSTAQLSTVSTIRYGGVPSMLMLAVLIVAAERLVLAHPLALRFVGGAIGVAVAASLILNVHATGHTLRAHGPRWSTQVSDAAKSCAPNTFVPLEAAPNASWQLLVSCEDLVANQG